MRALLIEPFLAGSHAAFVATLTGGLAPHRAVHRLPEYARLLRELATAPG